MATIVLTNPVIVVGSTSIRTYCDSVTVEYDADEVEDTNFGDDTHIFKGGGLFTWSVAATAKNDFAASQLDSIIFPLVGTTTTISVIPTTGAVSATNPNYNGSCLVKGFTPVAGGVGELSTTPLLFMSAGTLSRTTT